MYRLAFLVFTFLLGSTAVADDVMLSALQADWTSQERRLGREPNSLEAVQAALERIEKLENASGEKLAAFREQSKSFDTLSDTEKTALYESIRLYGRETALSHPEIPNVPLLFLKQRRFVCQMLHEYTGYYYDLGGVVDGGVYILEEPGKSFKVRSLTANLLPQGAYTSPALSYDGKTVYFAFCEVKDQERPLGTFNHWRPLPDAKDVPPEFNWNSPDRKCFHIYAINVDGTNLRQLTDGCRDDFDPCPLPDGGIAFMSSRRGGYIRCGAGFEPLPSCTLHRMDADGKNIRTLSWHETNEWNPAVLNDGRIVYSRWDYVDRSAAHFHGLWASNPNGTAPVVLFGNYTMELNAAYQPRAVPNSNKIAFIAGAHHAAIGGSLVLFDPAKVRLDPDTGEDCFDSLERLTPEVCFPETSEGWPKSYFSSPVPLSEDRFLAAFSFKPIPSMWHTDDSQSGLYYYDRFGNLELLYRDPEISSVAPIPLQPQPIPPVLPSVLDSELAQKNEGEFSLTDVNMSHFPLPKDRPIKSLRIFEILLKTESHVANVPRLGHANAESARRYLGEVPVEEDGSAFFRAPAEVPLYFQAVDAEGKAVQSMRSITYLQSGERRSCVGCHEPLSAAPPHLSTIKAANTREPSHIVPGPSGSNPMNFPKLVQPVLDRNCIECHETWTDERQSRHGFSAAYNALEPFVRFYEWGDKSISQITTKPGECGADMSPLSKILKDSDHAEMFKKMSEEDKRRIYLWLDANAPFYGAN